MAEKEKTNRQINRIRILTAWSFAANFNCFLRNIFTIVALVTNPAANIPP